MSEWLQELNIPEWVSTLVLVLGIIVPVKLILFFIKSKIYKSARDAATFELTGAPDFQVNVKPK